MLKKNKKNNFSSRGSVILFGVLFTAIILVIGLSLGVLIISKIKQERSLNNSIVAYYNAEQGVEKGLYQVRQQGADINSLNENVNNGDNKWKMKGTDKIGTELKISLLPQASPTSSERMIKINLYNPTGKDSNGTIDYHAGVKELEISCQPISSRSSSAPAFTPTLDIYAQQWDMASSSLKYVREFVGMGGNNLTMNKSEARVKHIVCDGNFYLITGLLQPSYAYQIILQSDQPVKNIKIKALDNSGNPVSLVGNKVIKATGFYVNAQTGVEAEMPNQPPWD